MSKIILKFTRDHGKYAKGDVAGFDLKAAQSILATGAALQRGADGAFTAPAQSSAPSAVAGVDAERSAALDAREADLAAKQKQMDDAFARKMAELTAFTSAQPEDVQNIDMNLTVLDVAAEPDEQTSAPPVQEKVEASSKDVGAAPAQGRKK